jgi:hypothetical protein
MKPVYLVIILLNLYLNRYIVPLSKRGPRRGSGGAGGLSLLSIEQEKEIKGELKGLRFLAQAGDGCGMEKSGRGKFIIHPCTSFLFLVDYRVFAFKDAGEVFRSS